VLRHRRKEYAGSFKVTNVENKTGIETCGPKTALERKLIRT